jgi:pentose-5-phosphate-3-epimerase
MNDPAHAWTDATYDLVVEVDSLGHAIDRFVTDHQQLVTVHVELARAARRVVQAYHDECLDGTLLDALDVAVTKSRAFASQL